MNRSFGVPCLPGQPCQPYVTRLRGRLAPSPTGALHLGNAWAFLLAWLAARAGGGEIVLRMEDIDPDRSRPEWALAIMDDLRWLGLDWDAGPSHAGAPGAARVADGGPFWQSQCGDYYEQACHALEGAGLLYPCYCTRKELRTLAGAPHGFSVRAGGPGEEGADAGAPYPGICRHLSQSQRQQKEKEGRRAAWRFACPTAYPDVGPDVCPEACLDEDQVCFEDAVLGPQCFSLQACGGDFPLRRSDGVWAYQLAVVVDDARMGITQVTRGEDILVSTPRQMTLFRHLGLSTPQYAHIPLLHDQSGERLAKRHQSLSLRSLREAGVAPELLTGWLADVAWNGNADASGLARPEQAVAASPAEWAERLRREGNFPWATLRPYSLVAGGLALRVPDNVMESLVQQSLR